MPIGIKTFVETFEDMEITGVYNLDYPPLPGEVNTDLLPGKWVDSIRRESEPLHRGRVGGEVTNRCRVVILSQPASQGENAGRWDVVKRVAADLDTAIESTTSAGLTLSWITTIDPNFEGAGFYAVTAEVEGMG